MNLDTTDLAAPFSSEATATDQPSPPIREGEPEWVGGFFSLPITFHTPTESITPEGLYWICGKRVLGLLTGRPGSVLGRAGECLQEAIEHPLSGEPRRPQHLRVASVELALVLRSSHPELEIVVAPTPEIDRLRQAFLEHLARTGAAPVARRARKSHRPAARQARKARRKNR